MKILQKKEALTPRQRQINILKEDLRHCEMLLRRTQALFEMATDENLIEARIYEIKSLTKHYDYLISSIRALSTEESRSGQTVNV